MKPVASDSCNCLWRFCEHHKGAPCHGTATATHCHDHCDRLHWVGETLGEGIHLCHDCGDAIVTFFSLELVTFMAEFMEHIPRQFHDLHNIVQRHYKREYESSLIFGWTSPITDMRVVMGFVMLVTTYKQYTNKPVPNAILDTVELLTAKLLTLVTDMRADTLHVQKGD